MGSPAFRPVALALVAALAGAAAAQEATSDLVAFHPVASLAATRPANEKDLKVRCEVQLDDRAPAGYRGLWLSFLGTETDRVTIAAFTRSPIKVPSDTISLRTRFNPLPTALVTSAATLDWTYVYDRNRDGRVDYLVYLQNAHAVLPEPVPADFPRPQVLADGRLRLSKELAYAMIDHAQMVFRHYADDDFDGSVDGVVVEEFDPERPMFVRGYVAYLRERGSTPERAWAFRRGITESTRAIAGGPGAEVQLPTVEAGVTEPASARLAHGTRVLGLINDGLARCPAASRALPAGVPAARRPGE